MELIDKTALLAEIERLKNTSLEYGYNTMQKILADSGKDISLRQLQNFIDTLEVKEVGLEKESLTWKDIGTIDQLLWDLSGEHSGKSDNEGYYKAVLSRFKAQKVK